MGFRHHSGLCLAKISTHSFSFYREIRKNNLITGTCARRAKIENVPRVQIRQGLPHSFSSSVRTLPH